MSAIASTASRPSLTLKRRINASPARVYAAWTDPGQVARWWGPEGAVVLRAEIDLRVGGRFRKITRTLDGEEHEVSGVYRELVPEKKLVFTWAWRTTPQRQSLVTVLLKEEHGGTLLTLIHEQFFDEAARDRHRFGWTGALDSLERLLM